MLKTSHNQQTHMMKNGKLDNSIPNLQLIFKAWKNKNNGCVFISYTFKNICPKHYTYKKQCITRISKGARWLKIKTKCFWKPKWYISNVRPITGKGSIRKLPFIGGLQCFAHARNYLSFSNLRRSWGIVASLSGLVR